MVWQENVRVVVNLARLEGGFAGSCQYWPTTDPSPPSAQHQDPTAGEAFSSLVIDRAVPSVRFGDIVVALRSETRPVPGTAVRQLDLHLDQSRGGREFTRGCAAPRRVTQVHFTAWPNYGVPESPLQIMFRGVECTLAVIGTGGPEK
eukprot:2634415-Pyramimonas_sp.AAC.1